MGDEQFALRPACKKYFRRRVAKNSDGDEQSVVRRGRKKIAVERQIISQQFAQERGLRRARPDARLSKWPARGASAWLFRFAGRKSGRPHHFANYRTRRH